MGDSIRLREDDILWQEVNDELVVLDLRSSMYLRLNGSGAMLWKLLASPRTKWDLVAALLERYDVDETRATADVDAFVDKMAKKKLLA